MSGIKFRDANSQWVDPCTVPVRVRDASGNWQLVKNLTGVFDGTEWSYVMCTAPVTLSASTVLPSTVTQGGNIIISGYLGGVTRSYSYDYLGGSNSFMIDKGLPVTYEWDTTVANIKINNIVISQSPYTAIPTKAIVLEILLR